MHCRIPSIVCLLFLTAASPARAQAVEEPPAFMGVPELMSGFRLLYIQKFPEARAQFTAWESQHPGEAFGEVCVAASYLFEEFYRQGVLTSDFFLNEKKFLHGIEGQPDPSL